MSRIEAVSLRRVLDSRGNPTVEADVLTESGGFGRAIAPSGASTGQYEAVELPPSEAIPAAREHAVPRLEDNVFAVNQRSVDATLRAADGTTDFSMIGANSSTAISMATGKAAADLLGVPLYHHLGGAFRGSAFPIPLGNVIGGGAHAPDATDIQEFLSVPVGAPSVTDAVFANARVHQMIGTGLREQGIPATKGDEGGWAPAIDDEQAIEIVTQAVETVTDEVGFSIRIGLDVAASELYEDGSYQYGNLDRSPDEQLEYMVSLINEYDIVYVEDPFEENDFEGFARLTDRVSEDVLVCGDDLFVTNTDRIADGVERGAANAVLIKPNQIGTLSDTIDAIELTARNAYTPVVSHRSGETEDTTIAHLAFAVGAPYIKTGTVSGERTAKLNELIRIEQEAL